MGGIGPNLQLQSDGSEILCAVRAPCKTYSCKYVIFCELLEKISVPDIKNLGLVRPSRHIMVTDLLGHFEQI